MVQRVIVATDGGDASRAAIDWVIGYAQNTTIDVDIVTVLETGHMVFGSDPVEYRETCREYLVEGERRLTKHHGIATLTTTLMFGVPSQEIADASQVADLVVVGSNPGNPASAALRATLALRLAPRSDCPLIVVPSSWDGRSGSIVVGVDDDSSSDMAVERAALEAAKSGRELVVVHTWLPAQPFTFVGRNREPEFPSVKRLHQKSLDSAIARARRVAPRIRLTPILLFGPTLRGLAVAARDASLLVVGTHRHGIIADAVLGGTGEKILATATFPVMIVNSDLISRDAPRGIVSRTTA